MLKSVSLGDVECDYGSIDLLIERLNNINLAAKAAKSTSFTTFIYTRLPSLVSIKNLDNLSVLPGPNGGKM